MFDLTRMEVGREYTLEEIPGFPVEVPAMVVACFADAVRHPFMRAVYAALKGKRLRFVVVHEPTGRRYRDVQDVPLTYGDPEKRTGLSEISIRYVRRSTWWAWVCRAWARCCGA